VKFCRDCRYAVLLDPSRMSDASSWFCGHEEGAGKTGDISLITGEPLRPLPSSCWDMRSKGRGLCGPEGFLFEARG
jgi:hypothetical protein